jgi:hypothetical protein
VALPNPSSSRRVFRPSRRVSWGTWIFAILVLCAAVGATAAILVVILPARVLDLGKNEAEELSAARAGAVSAQQSLSGLWADLTPSGPFAVAPEKLAADLNTARGAEKQANDALGHAENAKAYLLQADGMPFQLHSPAFVSGDRPAVLQLETGLQVAAKLAHAATLQLTLAQDASADQQLWSSQLDPALNARSWAQAARTAATLQSQLKAEQLGVGNPDALLDPLWSKWVDARFAYSQTAQAYALNAASGQTVTAQQLQRTMTTQLGQVQAAQSAAKDNAAPWGAKTIQPLLNSTAKAFAAGGAS